MKILLLDNYDSFTFNLLHYLQNSGAMVDVVRNDELQPEHMHLYNYDASVLSPGPCTPTESGELMKFIATNVGQKPMLGVCLGMQALGIHYGWKLQKANVPVHGKSSFIQHNGKGIFFGIENPMQVGRYHSLVIHDTGNGELKTQAQFEGEIMAVSNLNNTAWGVQFHPESILTPFGQKLISNWVRMILPN